MTTFKQTFRTSLFDEPGVEENLELIREMPLDIHVEGMHLSTAFRTPGHERAQAAGACVGEGLLADRGDLKEVCGDVGKGCGKVDVKVSESSRQKARSLMEFRASQSHFDSDKEDKEIAGILCANLPTFSGHDPIISARRVHSRAQSMKKIQDIHRITRSAHASMACDRKLNVLAAAEDVGRHNALDKAIGMTFLANELDQTDVAVISCRINKDVVRKCANARIPIVVSISRPTAMAAYMAQHLNMTIALSTRDDGLLVFSCKERLG